MHQLDGHPRPLTIDGILARFAKMNFAQKIWLLPDFEPVIVRELDQNPILVAVVDDVQISRLIIELEIVDTQLFGMLNINGGLHLSAIAQSRPMTGAERSLFIRELRLALFPSHVHVQLMVLLFFMFSVCFMLPLLPGLHFPGAFAHLLATGSRRNCVPATQSTKNP